MNKAATKNTIFEYIILYGITLLFIISVVPGVVLLYRPYSYNLEEDIYNGLVGQNFTNIIDNYVGKVGQLVDPLKKVNTNIPGDIMGGMLLENIQNFGIITPIALFTNFLNESDVMERRTVIERLLFNGGNTNEAGTAITGATDIIKNDIGTYLASNSTSLYEFFERHHRGLNLTHNGLSKKLVFSLHTVLIEYQFNFLLGGSGENNAFLLLLRHTNLLNQLLGGKSIRDLLPELESEGHTEEHGHGHDEDFFLAQVIAYVGNDNITNTLIGKYYVSGFNGWDSYTVMYGLFQYIFGLYLSRQNTVFFRYSLGILLFLMFLTAIVVVVCIKYRNSVEIKSKYKPFIIQLLVSLCWTEIWALILVFIIKFMYFQYRSFCLTFTVVGILSTFSALNCRHCFLYLIFNRTDQNQLNRRNGYLTTTNTDRSNSHVIENDKEEEEEGDDMMEVCGVAFVEKNIVYENAKSLHSSRYYDIGTAAPITDESPSESSSLGRYSLSTIFSGLSSPKISSTLNKLYYFVPFLYHFPVIIISAFFIYISIDSSHSVHHLFSVTKLWLVVIPWCASCTFFFVENIIWNYLNRKHLRFLNQNSFFNVKLFISMFITYIYLGWISTLSYTNLILVLFLFIILISLVFLQIMIDSFFLLSIRLIFLNRIKKRVDKNNWFLQLLESSDFLDYKDINFDKLIYLFYNETLTYMFLQYSKKFYMEENVQFLIELRTLQTLIQDYRDDVVTNALDDATDRYHQQQIIDQFNYIFIMFLAENSRWELNITAKVKENIYQFYASEWKKAIQCESILAIKIEMIFKPMMEEICKLLQLNLHNQFVQQPEVQEIIRFQNLYSRYENYI